MNMTELEMANAPQAAGHTERNALTSLLLNGVTFVQQPVVLDFGRCTMAVRANDTGLLKKLRDYFAHIVVQAPRQDVDIEVLAIERDPMDLPITFYDWKREPGKSGRKDAVYDIGGARFIHKVRTGMLFLQSMEQRIAVGPCLQNDNQVINFINNQYMTWLQQRGWHNCHAAALVKDGFAYAVAGFSGGGKSTLSLQMLEDEHTQFLSNDRLFIQPELNGLQAMGVPKMPRINPGTIIHNPRLTHLIPESERAQLQALPAQALWDLEQKYDVDIDTVYGHGRIVTEAPLRAFLVLNWQRDSAEPLRMRKVNLRERPDLLVAIMKAPGPFYQQADGVFSQDTYDFDQDAYLQALALVDVYEATGQVDFKTLAKHYLLQEEI